MNVTNIIRGVVNATKYTVTAPIIKEDYGLYLKIEGLDLPTVYEVDFSNSENSGSSVTMVGNADGVLIPRQFIKSGQDVFAFLYWNGEDFGRTVYKFRIPNKLRPDRTEEQPTPEEQSLIDQAISALNSAVEQTAEDVETTTAKAAEATSAAATATQKASEAAASADDAGTYATRAETALHGAETARMASQQSATASATSAEQAAGSALTASTKAGDASASATAAAQSASSAGQSALDARGYKDAANLSAESASEYAGSASDSATTATEQATIATNKAAESAQSALDASAAKDDAVTAKTAAETAQTAAETAQGLAEDAQTGAETAQAAAEAAVYAKADGIVDTATGAVASFPDGADNFPMESLKVAIDPVQDLHGYENPWPAGGGKNLIVPTDTTVVTQEVTIVSSQSDETIKLSGTATGNGGRTRKLTELTTLQAGTYYFSAYGNSAGVALNRSDNTVVTWANNSFTLEAETSVYVGVNLSKDATYNETIKIALVTGSTAPTDWTPYENICPITGWTGMEVYDDPKYGGEITWNQLARLESVSIPSASKGITYSYTDGTSVKINGTATGIENRTGWFNLLETAGLPETKIGHSMFFASKLVSGTINGSLQFMFTGNSGTTRDVGVGFIVKSLAKSSTKQIRVGFNIAENTVCTNAIVTLICCDLTEMFGAGNEPSTVEEFRALFPKDYYPYNAGEKTCVSAVNGDIHRHVSIEFPQEAGTVYGGTIDVVSGELVVDKASVDLGTLNWSYHSNTAHFYATISSSKTTGANFMCSQYAYNGVAETSAMSDKPTGLYRFSNIFRIKDTRFTDAATFKTAMDGVQLVYELATPIIYHLTPTEVRTMLGQNNVWADTGDSTVEYYADTKRYIDKKIAELDN